MTDEVKELYDRLCRRVVRLKEELSVKSPTIIIKNELKLIESAVQDIREKLGIDSEKE